MQARDASLQETTEAAAGAAKERAELLQSLEVPLYRIRPHASAYVSMRQHTSAYAAKEQAKLLQSLEVPYIEYASIRPHTSAYVQTLEVTYRVTITK
jgi:hypothetical protein